jgi:cupin superfamily acireductone dioxygenase involved in methionine salvage
LDLREIRCDDTDWIHLPEGTDQWRTLVNTAVHHRVP